LQAIVRRFVAARVPVIAHFQYFCRCDDAKRRGTVVTPNLVGILRYSTWVAGARLRKSAQGLRSPSPA
jgi:hypothetical protein